MKRPESECRAIVWQNIEVHAVNPGQKEMLDAGPFVKEFVRVKLIEQRMVHEYVLGHHKSRCGLKDSENRTCRFGTFVVVKNAFLRFYSAPDVVFFHYSVIIYYK